VTQDVNVACRTLAYPDAFLTAFVAAKAALQDTLLPRLRGKLSADLLTPDAKRVASQLGMSERTLQRRLKESATTFSDQVMHCRIEKAQSELASTQKTVLCIALELGFATPEHFATCFREREGLSPTEYRKHMSLP
jgi:AraC-like DNA-binding protein